ncbi:nucleotidyltransferase domain-containing protein [Sporanaerobacter acetigenes]|uniref:Uncharacterized nucleotidyltransferase n=1 Tax=Sporanaerobacter acetigenes DSM 13106 TaxID=1123281 RepID=A0A1M5Z8R0_9FIRM|nr:nucleotidyltransferase family protein [Sporanaerobacter acetigenes]SHI20616.1 Uncharacterised nucleotidyltransferase [Sporanaerobacter acetigenes DSM 13106]
MKEIDAICNLLCNRNETLENIDFIEFNKMVHGLNMQHLIYEKIKAMNNIPLDIKKDYKNDYEKTKILNTLQCKVLCKVLEQFDLEKIEVIVFKGAYLVDKVYKKIGLRKMGDVDVLIHKKDLDRAINILINNGFKYKEEHCSKAWFDENYYRTALYVKGPVEIELHWDLLPVVNPLKFNIEDIWNTAEDDKLFDISVKEMKIELLLIYLCIHVSYCHFFNHNSIRRLYDIYLILLSKEIDWSYFIDKSIEYDLNKFVGVSLSYVNEIFEEIVSNKVISSLIDERTLKRFKKEITISELFRNKRTTNSSKIMETQRLIQLIGMNDKLRYIKLVSTQKSCSGKWIAALFDVSPDSMKVLVYNWIYLLRILPKYLLGRTV